MWTLKPKKYSVPPSFALAEFLTPHSASESLTCLRLGLEWARTAVESTATSSPKSGNHSLRRSVISAKTASTLETIAKVQVDNEEAR